MGKNGGFKFRGVVWTVLISFTIGQIGLLSPPAITQEKLAPLHQLSKAAGSKENSSVPERSKGGLRGGAVSAIAAAALLWLGATPSLSQEAGAETVAPEAAEGAASLAASETPLEELVQKIGEGSIEAVFTFDETLRVEPATPIPQTLYSVNIDQLLIQFEKGDPRAFEAINILRQWGHQSLYWEVQNASIEYWRVKAEEGNSKAQEVLVELYRNYGHPSTLLLALLNDLKKQAEEGQIKAVGLLMEIARSGSKVGEKGTEVVSSMDVGSLIEAAKQKDNEALRILVRLEPFHNPKVDRFIREWDPQALVDAAEEGMMEEAKILFEFALFGNTKALAAIGKFNPAKLVDEIKKGDQTILEMQFLNQLTGWGQNQALKELLKNWEVEIFVKRAEEEGSVQDLLSLKSFDNPQAAAAIVTLDVSKLVETIKANYESGIWDLFSLAEAGNLSAKQALLDWDCQRLRKRAEEMDSFSLGCLIRLFDFNNRSAQNEVLGLDPQSLLASANEGNESPLSDLRELAKRGNVKANQKFQQADPKVFLERANQGDANALYYLSRYAQENARFKQALAEVNPAVLLEMANQGDEEAVRLLDEYARYNRYFKEAVRKINPAGVMAKAKSGDLNAMNRTLELSKDNPSIKKELKEMNAQVFVDQLAQITRSSADTSSHKGWLLRILSDLLRLGNAALLPSVIELAQEGDSGLIESLVWIAYEQEIPLHGQITKALGELKIDPSYAKKVLDNDEQAQNVIVRLAAFGNKAAMDLLSEWVGGGNTQAILAIHQSSIKREECEKIFEKVDIQSLIEKGASGEGRAIQALAALRNYRIEKDIIDQRLQELDLSVLEKGAEEDPVAAQAIRVLVEQFNNVQAEEVVKRMNLTRLVELSTTSYEAADLVVWYVFHGNENGIRNLEESIRNGNQMLVGVLNSWANTRVLDLRQAHLEDRISDEELKTRLTTTSFSDNPLLLYIYFNSAGNFGDLAKMIFTRLQGMAKDKKIDLITLLKQLDPHQFFYEEFILQAANFGLLDDLLITPQALQDVMDELFKDFPSDKLRGYSTRLALFVEVVTQDKNFAHQEAFQKYLLKLYYQTLGVHQKFIGMILKIYQDQLKYLRPNELPQGIEVPGSNDTVPYERLLNKDGELVVHIVFVDNDAVAGHYDETASFFQQKGYVKIGGNGNRLILQQGKVQIVLFKANDGSYDISQGWKEAGIIISRSHAGKERVIFDSQVHLQESEGKMGGMSACRSVTSIGAAAIQDPNTFWFGINATAYGMRTNQFTYELLRGLTLRIKTFGQIKKLMEQRLAANGQNWIGEYVMPGDRSYTLTVAIERLFQDAMDRSVSQAQRIQQQEQQREQESPTGSYREWTLALLTFPDQRQFLTLIRNTGSSVPDAGRVQIESSL